MGAVRTRLGGPACLGRSAPRYRAHRELSRNLRRLAPRRGAEPVCPRALTLQ
jgi:hypothetical protein